jgi:hypothetical protein
MQRIQFKKIVDGWYIVLGASLDPSASGVQVHEYLLEKMGFN